MQVPVARVTDPGWSRGSRTFSAPPYDAGSGGAEGAPPVGEAGGEVERNIEALLTEDRVFEPPPGFRETAVAADPGVYDEANRDHEAFWAEEAGRLTWTRPWDSVMDWNPPWVTWFAGGQLNASVNCLDRHVEAGGGDKVAFHWEGEPGDTRVLTYRDLLDEVSRLANALRSLGVGKGDRVNIYLGMVPELPIAMLACARIGAPHSVVFGGFSAEALRDRINDAEAKVLITADGAWRRGAVVPLKDNADAAVAECPSIEHVITVRRCGNEHAFTEGRDHWYHELVADQSTECPPEPMDAEDFLYLLYTSGTTGKPKGIAHTTGGYMTQVATTHRMIFDIHDDDVYWCAADCGWVTGHSYIVYGPLAQPHDGRAVRGRAGLARQGPLVVDHREVPRHRSSTRRRPRSARSCGGGRSSPPSTTCRRCGCWARSASRSTPRPGSGTGR